jgi:hypothetical protein
MEQGEGHWGLTLCTHQYVNDTYYMCRSGWLKRDETIHVGNIGDMKYVPRGGALCQTRNFMADKIWRT